ncbi:MAG: 16S rRNA (uracil(1498)-N(3))-methyltransferase [Bacteroidota bacterium]
MHLFYTPDILSIPFSNEPFLYTLNEDESKHGIRVLRLTTGSKIVLIDGQGGWYHAEIVDDNPKRCSVNITKTIKECGKRSFHLHIAIAPTKNMDRLEWFTEKATEMGIDEISTINCKNSERPVVKTERLNKVAISAIKQSLKAYLPKVNEMLDFKKFMASTANFQGQKFIAHCYDGEVKPHLKELYQKGSNTIVLIGPEGDFTADEVKLALDNGYKEIGLGNSRLRTETAALYACTTVNILNE